MFFNKLLSESTHNFENALSSIEPYFAANTLTNKLEKMRKNYYLHLY